MEQNPIDRSQMAQRLLVGVTGLAVVLLLILVAGAVYRSASSEAPPDVVGAPKPETLANMTAQSDSNLAAPDHGDDDPLAALGIAPGTKPVETPTPTPTAPPPTAMPSAAPPPQN